MSDYQKSILRWAGSKWQLLNEILPLLTGFDRLIEPFLGSAVIAANAPVQTVVAGDLNADLVDLWNWVKRDPEQLAARAAHYFRPSKNTPEHYYRLRKRFNQEGSGMTRSVLFWWLNRHNYNGLCRYNATGEFNVPFGEVKSPPFQPDQVFAMSRALQHVTVCCRDFRETLALAGRGTVAYIDSPYIPVGESQFRYEPGGFSLTDQEELVAHARAAAGRGARVVISNSDCAVARALLKGATIKRVAARRSIGNESSRGKTSELLAVFEAKTAPRAPTKRRSELASAD